MNVIWSATSVRHLQDVVSYLEGESSNLAVTTRRRILETKRRISQMPNSGRIGRVAGTREAVVQRTPYIVVYRIKEKTVEILGIWHTSRLWPESF